MLSKKEQKVFQLILFRKNMKAFTSKNDLKKFWGSVDREALKECKEKSLKEKNLSIKKIAIVKRHINDFLFLDWVKFIGITGSVAAGVPKEKDDIDVFIVVKNNRMWLYRAILTLQLGRKSLRRVWDSPVKDKIDTNFICEERGLLFNTESIFVLHELLFMIPVYKEEYYEKILNINYKLLENYCIKRKKEYVNTSKNIPLIFLDKTAFFLQYMYMLFRNHRPNWKRLVRNNKKGRIAFFPEDFRRKKMEEFENLKKDF